MTPTKRIVVNALATYGQSLVRLLAGFFSIRWVLAALIVLNLLPNKDKAVNGIQELRENGMGRENIPAMMAAVVVISLPLIILFLIFRRKIMAGVARGGTKG